MSATHVPCGRCGQLACRCTAGPSAPLRMFAGLPYEQQPWAGDPAYAPHPCRDADAPTHGREQAGAALGASDNAWEQPGSPAQPRLTIVPLTFRAACAFVEQHHRHHKAPRGHKFSIGVVDEVGELRGVAMVGRPVARAYDDGFTAEVNRTCTDGCPNANSSLYAAAWRTARGMGYTRLITYTQEGESGASLKGAGWRVIAQRMARGSWAESTGDERLKAMRDEQGAGGVQRQPWEVASDGRDRGRARPTRRG